MKRFLRAFAWLLLAADGYYAYRVADLYFRQDSYVYHPKKEWVETPTAKGLEFQELTFGSSDDASISAWYIPAKTAKGTILFCHGNARNMSSDMDAIEMFHQDGFNVLAFDYRGYGKSTGHPTEQGTYEDAQKAWDWLTRSKKEQPSRIIICGRSLGAAIAAHLAAGNPPKALILEAAFTSLPEAGQDNYPYFPVKLLSKYRYNTLEALKQVRCPVLVVHSRDDKVVPFSHGKKLYEAARGPKTFVEIGGPHKGGYKPTLGIYHEGVKRFLESL